MPADHVPLPGNPPPSGSFHSAPAPERASVVSAAPAGSRWKRGFSMLPYFGFHSFRNHEAAAYGPGLRIGSFAGGRVSELVSINGELTIDRAKINSPIDLEQWFFRISLSPLVHLPAGRVEVGLGPKVGIYSVSTNWGGTGTTIESASTGYSTGLNAAVFAPLSPGTALAGLLSFDLMWSKRMCASGLGGENQCGPTTDVGNVLGVTGGVLF